MNVIDITSKDTKERLEIVKKCKEEKIDVELIDEEDAYIVLGVNELVLHQCCNWRCSSDENEWDKQTIDEFIEGIEKEIREEKKKELIGGKEDEC